jgi:hypothetical protein
MDKALSPAISKKGNGFVQDILLSAYISPLCCALAPQFITDTLWL